MSCLNVSRFFVGIEPLDTQNDAIDTCLNTIILGIYVKFGLSINMYIVFIYIYLFKYIYIYIFVYV